MLNIPQKGRLVRTLMTNGNYSGTFVQTTLFIGPFLDLNQEPHECETSTLPSATQMIIISKILKNLLRI